MAICRQRTNSTNEVDFTSIVEHFHCPLFRFAASLVRNESDAADLVQQTFLKLAENSHQIRDFSRIKCWLFTILRREFLMTVRRQKKLLETEFIPGFHDPPTREPEPSQSLDPGIVLDANRHGYVEVVEGQRATQIDRDQIRLLIICQRSVNCSKRVAE
jgi:DNA-directed RNA polymerase specialized sigma24 family protein